MTKFWITIQKKLEFLLVENSAGKNVASFQSHINNKNSRFLCFRVAFFLTTITVLGVRYMTRFYV